MRTKALVQLVPFILGRLLPFKSFFLLLLKDPNVSLKLLIVELAPSLQPLFVLLSPHRFLLCIHLHICCQFLFHLGPLPRIFLNLLFLYFCPQFIELLPTCLFVNLLRRLHEPSIFVDFDKPVECLLDLNELLGISSRPIRMVLLHKL